MAGTVALALRKNPGADYGAGLFKTRAEYGAVQFAA
jgi:hypothetical protein